MCNTLLLCLISVVISLVETKKYDVETEAQKLFGQNLTSVLERFRKSRDYLQILSEKADDLRNEMADIRVKILAYYQKKMKRKISEIVGFKTESTSVGLTSSGNRTRKKAARRQQNTEIDDVTQNKIDRIDNYDLLNSYLTVEERNEFKDLGFKYIGEAIHSVVKKMGIEQGDEVGSTRMIDGGPPHAHRVKRKHRRLTTVSKDSNEEKSRLSKE